MSDADDSKANEPGEADDKDEATEKDASSKDDVSKDDEGRDSDRPVLAAAAAAEPRRKRPRTKARVQQPEPTPSPVSGPLIVAAVVALAVGAAGGWFGHKAQAKAELQRESAPAASGSAGAVSGPCGAWQQKICASLGEHSAACEQAKSATELLTTSSCEAAIQALPATLTKVKAARAVCDKLMTKLCADLPPGSQTCAMVKERTPSFPTARCDQMIANYAQVIAQLKMMDQQGQMGGGHPQMGGPQMGGPQMGGPRPPGMQMGRPGAPQMSQAPAPTHT